MPVSGARAGREVTARVVPEPIAEPVGERLGDGRAGRDVARAPLPGDRPAAGLEPDVVGAAPGQQHRAVGRVERQDARLGLEQHQGLGHRLAGELPVGRGPDVRRRARSAASGRSKSPISNLTRRIRRTASSTRVPRMSPLARPARTASWNRRPSYGTMAMSMPAVMALATAAS